MLFKLFILIMAGLCVFLFKDTTANPVLNEANRKKYITVMMLLLALQSGLRNVAVGPDTFQYYLHFENVVDSSWELLWTNFTSFLSGGEGKDPGYALLQKTFSVIFPSYRIYLLCVAAFFFYALGKVLRMYTNSNVEVMIAISLYMCLYYTFFSITGIRQTIATGFLLLSIPYVAEKRFFKFLLLVLIAATQHKSALLFLPFYCLVFCKDSRKIIYMALILFVPMWKFGGSLAKYLVMGSVFEQYMSYLDGSEKAGAYTFAIYIIMLAVMMLANYKMLANRNNSSYLVLNAVALALLLTPLTMIDPNNMRIVQYYSIFGLLVFPMACTGISKKIHFRSFVLCVFLFLSIYTIMQGGEYRFFWQDMYLGDNYGYRLVNDSVLKY